MGPGVGRSISARHDGPSRADRHAPAPAALRRSSRSRSWTSPTRPRTRRSSSASRRGRKTTAPGEWIMTTPVGEPHFFVTRSWRDLAEGRLPDRHVLDRASREHPVMIQAWAPVTPNVMRLQQHGAGPARPRRTNARADRRGLDREGRSGSADGDPDRIGHQLLQLRQLQPLAVAADPLRAVGQGVRSRRARHAPVQRPRGHDHLREPRDGGRAHRCYRALRLADALTLRVAVAQEAESYGLPWSRPKTVDEFTRDCEQAADERRDCKTGSFAFSA